MFRERAIGVASQDQTGPGWMGISLGAISRDRQTRHWRSVDASWRLAGRGGFQTRPDRGQPRGYRGVYVRVVGKRAELRGYLDWLGMVLSQRACEHAQALVGLQDLCRSRLEDVARQPRVGMGWRCLSGKEVWRKRAPEEGRTTMTGRCGPSRTPG